MTTRRDLLIAFGALTALPAYSQQPGKVWRIGWLSTAAGPIDAHDAFREQLRSLGYIEGRNLSIEYRWAAGKDERLPEMAADLVRLKVDVIVAQASISVAVAKRATSTIPIVMSSVADPVGAGLVTSLTRPGGNVTGSTSMSVELAAKRLQLLREILPKASRVAILTYKGGLTVPFFIGQIQAAARPMGIKLLHQQLTQTGEFTAAFAAMQRERAQALIVQSSPFTQDHRQLITELAAQQHLPTILESRVFVDAGGLISYGPSLIETMRRNARYVDKIFKGARPADLPVEQPTIFEMIVNQKTAKALGLAIPKSVLLRADEVIR